MIILQNETLLVEVNPKGAELTRIFQKLEQLDYLWNGDPAVWAKHSPVLFPIVGTLRDNRYRHQGAEYSLTRHGFARDMMFTVEKETAEEVTLQLESNEDTMKIYPFRFRFQITYRLHLNTLWTTYNVINIDDNDILFSVGAHPAFNVPLKSSESYTDYTLHFNKPEQAKRWPISPDGLIDDTPIEVFKSDNATTLRLDKSLFQKDALVFRDLQSDTITLMKGDRAHIKFQFPGFPFFGIWAAKNADFVCLEPWCGIADSVNASGDIADKEGIVRLGSRDKFSRTWSATFS